MQAQKQEGSPNNPKPTTREQEHTRCYMNTRKEDLDESSELGSNTGGLAYSTFTIASLYNTPTLCVHSGERQARKPGMATGLAVLATVLLHATVEQAIVAFAGCYADCQLLRGWRDP